ncbi:MAG TPA: type II CAAX endopeptidase family protein [Terriglobales bacterium]|nr:type II CAAX endopeptidase family protein [Terriglobales bacterium]
MTTDAPIRLGPSPAPARRHRPLAPWWHTLILIVVLIFASLNGFRGKHPLTAGGSKLPEYLATLLWEWILLGFVWLGVRKRIRWRELIGGRWEKLEDLFLDILYAALFWGCAMFVLGVAGRLMHLEQAGKLEGMRRQLGFLAPRTNLDLAVWFCVSATAGFCEEIIFRGYLQRQFAVLGDSMPLGVLLSAIVFGASHGYEGIARMILITLYGFMFGLLAWWRKSLRPGMIAHVWHDSLSGALLRVMK